MLSVANYGGILDLLTAGERTPTIVAALGVVEDDVWGVCAEATGHEMAASSEWSGRCCIFCDYPDDGASDA